MNLKIGDRVYVHGYVDEIRKDTVIIRNEGGYFGTIPNEVIKGEFVSCKDCRHWINEHLCECLSRHGSFETKPNFFCGYAERKEE